MMGLPGSGTGSLTNTSFDDCCVLHERTSKAKTSTVRNPKNCLLVPIAFLFNVENIIKCIMYNYFRILLLFLDSGRARNKASQKRLKLSWQIICNPKLINKAL